MAQPLAYGVLTDRRAQASRLAPRCAADPSGWLGRCHGLGRDHERTPEHAEAMIKVAMIRLLSGEDVEPEGPPKPKPHAG